MHPNEKIRPSQSLAINGRSFHWASLFLAPGTRDRAAQLYAFCRVLDDRKLRHSARFSRFFRIKKVLCKTKNTIAHFQDLELWPRINTFLFGFQSHNPGVVYGIDPSNYGRFPLIARVTKSIIGSDLGGVFLLYC